MKPKRAILLVRISDDREGEGLGVARQERDGRDHGDRLGWNIAEVVIENDTSAFKRRRVRLPDGTMALRVVRPGFRRSLDLLASGERDGLLAYDLDRTCRDPRDLEDLIDIVEEKRVPVSSVTGSLRLDNDADITMARVMVAIANKSSRDTARRVARKHEELAESGKPGGGGRRPYGYEPDGMTIREGEAEVVREMVERILSKHDDQCPNGCKDHAWTLRRLADDLNLRRVKPVYADSWGARSVSSILRGPRIAGLRRFRGEVVGEAAWPAIVKREDWEAVQPILTERGEGAKNQLLRWLTNALYCGRCDQQLGGVQGKGGPRYWCDSTRGGCGRIAINAALAEEEIQRQLLEYYARPDVLSRLGSTYSQSSASDARKELADDEQQLKELAGMWARKEVTFLEYTEARRIIATRVEASKALITSSLPSTVRVLLSAGTTRDGWEKIEPADRRAILLATVPGYTVMPAVPGRRFDPSRLVIRKGKGAEPPVA